MIAIVVFELREISCRRFRRCVGKYSSITRRDRRLRDRVNVTRRHGLTAECEVTLRADKRRTLVSLIDLVVENPAIIRRRSYVATLGAATRFHRHFLRLVIRRVQRRHVVTLRAFQIDVYFVTKRAGRDSIAPGTQRPPIGRADCRR